MSSTMQELTDLESKAASGAAFTRAEAERVLGAVDLVSIGVLGEAARKAHSADTVTFGRVADVPVQDDPPAHVPVPSPGAGEVRLVGVPTSIDGAVRWVAALRRVSGEVVMTAFSAADLLALCADDVARLAVLARDLRAAGLDAVAELPLDAFSSVDAATSVVEAFSASGLGMWRATVTQAVGGERLDLCERAASVQARTSALKAFAPLPRVDPADTPSTGYDDVRMVTVARLICASIPFIQVDWPLYGPKLAQVALAFGANDIDGIDAVEYPEAGPRRAPVADIARQIRAAFADPVERDGAYRRRP